MCGITGIVNRRGNVEEKELSLMTQKIVHRGPDASGIFINNYKTCGLGHRRLSIIDLSNAANQPMHSSCGKYTIVYNGEVYNYQEIKEDLQNKGIEFSTNSDTEVVLQAFIYWGSKCVEHFNGMFAFAIWNEEKEEIYIFRDRLGIKPLYYAWDEKTLYFSS